MEKENSKDGMPKEDWGYYEDEFGDEEPPDKDSDDFSDYEDYSSKKKKGKGKAKGKGVSNMIIMVLISPSRNFFSIDTRKMWKYQTSRSTL